MAKRTKPRYSDEFRAGAVLMLEAAGYPHRIGALAEVEKRLNVPGRTLSRWHNAEQNPPPDNVVRRKKIDLQRVIMDELTAIASGLEGTREEANYRDLIMGFGVMFDKWRILNDDATQIIGGAKGSPLTVVVKYADD